MGASETRRGPASGRSGEETWGVLEQALSRRGSQDPTEVGPREWGGDKALGAQGCRGPPLCLSLPLCLPGSLGLSVSPPIVLSPTPSPHSVVLMVRAEHRAVGPGGRPMAVPTHREGRPRLGPAGHRHRASSSPRPACGRCPGSELREEEGEGATRVVPMVPPTCRTCPPSASAGPPHCGGSPIMVQGPPSQCRV